MSDKGKRVIYVGPADDANHKPLNVEGVAAAAIAPGTVLKQTTTGLAASDIAATVFGQLFLVADKDQLRSRSVDDSWTADENMVAIQPRSGEFMNVLVATGQNLDPGTALTRNGAGLLIIAATDGTVEIVAYSDEDVTTTATQLVRVRVA
jgi:hypothetical protein